ESGLAADQLSAPAATRAAPTRRALLASLAKGEATVNELAEPFAISLQAVSKHLKVLERAGLVVGGRDAQWRPCRLETAPLEEASGWISRYTEVQAERLDRLDELVQGIVRDAAARRPGAAGQPGAGPDEPEADEAEQQVA